MEAKTQKQLMNELASEVLWHRLNTWLALPAPKGRVRMERPPGVEPIEVEVIWDALRAKLRADRGARRERGL